MFRITVHAEYPATHDSSNVDGPGRFGSAATSVPGTEERGRDMRRDPDRQRRLRRGDELPDDLDAPPDDTLDVAGSDVRGLSADEDLPDQPTGLLDERPQRRGLNRLIPTGWPRTR